MGSKQREPEMMSQASKKSIGRTSGMRPSASFKMNEGGSDAGQLKIENDRL